MTIDNIYNIEMMLLRDDENNHYACKSIRTQGYMSL